ncbi:unnamed protein product [Cylindrotheca closterium]|uniref:BZIP domain-containing protein n=1 Tax=Cylindrotheca closterium TaxID=2856 RepID=A0AAD2FX15_9STRA|nr:unnamed protein product [Cylindrotheca closterium]
MMATMVTSEELECRDILNDVGIFFSEDFGLLESGLTDGGDDFNDFMPISMTSPSTTKHIRVSPPTTPEMPASDALKELEALASSMPRSVSQFSFLNHQPLQGMPSLPTLMPVPTTMMPASAMQRAVSDISMTTAQSPPAVTNSRKRSVQGMLQTQADPEEQIRRNRNREHAKRSRQRKKAFTDDLTSTLEALREDTEKLRQELYSALGKEEVESILEEQKQKRQDDFLAAVKDPKNRVLDASAMKFLKGLSKKLPKNNED